MTKIRRQFPVSDWIEVDCGGGDILKVKYKFPSVQQSKEMASEGVEVAISICQYCVADIENLKDENEQPVVIKLERGCLPEDILVPLYQAGLCLPIAIMYRQKVAFDEIQKKS